ncbi:MAG: translation initiation factor IF-1 [Armatimonadetes bacterium]|nr:translation initiation factor IF-1 [Armatimonadota bacterium]
MSATEERELEGTVVEVLPKAMFRVRLSKGGEVFAHVSGDVKSLITRVLPGDRVRLELSPYHPGRGRIVTVVSRQSTS